MKAICILGPTAVGKSDLAVKAALRHGGEIVNSDSMQVFRHLEIGTGAPTKKMIEAVPHHLFQSMEPDQEPDAADWAATAAGVMKEIEARGGIPFVVGGTFFWVRVLFMGLSEIPHVPDTVRDMVLEQQSEIGTKGMHARLEQIDPVTAARLNTGDTQRILRAIEVFEATGKPLSSFYRQRLEPAISADVLKIVLSLPREELYSLIDSRVERMVKEGLVEEVRRALDLGFSTSVRPFKSGSYLPVIRHVAGEIGLHEMREEVARSHRNYAKRQLTWLRGEPDIVTVERRDEDKALRLIGEFLDG